MIHKHIHTRSPRRTSSPLVDQNSNSINQHYLDQTRDAYNSKNIIETLDFKGATVEPR